MASRGVIGVFLLSALPLLCLELRRGIPDLGKCWLFPSGAYNRITFPRMLRRIPVSRPPPLRAAWTTIPRLHRARLSLFRRQVSGERDSRGAGGSWLFLAEKVAFQFCVQGESWQKAQEHT